MFIDNLIEAIKTKENPSVVGLDTSFDYLPSKMKQQYFDKFGANFKAISEAVFDFNKNLIDGFYDLVPCVKVQVAYYESYGYEGLRAFERTMAYAREKGMLVIADCKRNDIGSTASAYAKAFIGKTNVNDELIEAFSSDSVTVNAYLGSDGIMPFIDQVKQNGTGIFVLVKTSNPSSGQFQDKHFKESNMTLYEEVAHKVVSWSEDTYGKYGYSNVGAVVGATYPEIAIKARKIMSKNFFLVPGYGAQGADSRFMKNFFNDDNLGAIVNSSRGIICAHMKKDTDNYVEAAREQVILMKEDLWNI